MRTIVFNSTNVVQNGQNNTYVYRFPVNATFKDNQVALASVSMYYSWFNISSALNNNKLTFNWVNASGTNNYTTYTVTIPDGLYEISSIRNYLQWVMFNAPSLSATFISPVPPAPFYLINANGDRVYYIDLVVNATSYAVQLDTYNVPNSLPVGWSNTGGTLLPLQTFNPVVSFPSDFNKIVGFTAGFSSAQNQNNATANPNTQTAYKIGSTFSYLSTTSPQVQPNPTLLMTMSCVNNSYSSPTSVIHAITPTVEIGQQIVEKVPEFAWQSLTDGSYRDLTIQFVTPDGSPIQLRDPNLTIILVVK